jgi:hypothetical protein
MRARMGHLCTRAGFDRHDFKTAKADVLRLVERIGPDYQHNRLRTNGNSACTAPTKPTKPIGTAYGWRENARYPYVDRDGTLLFDVVRYLKPDRGKAFMQCWPIGSGGFVWNLDGVERVPYRLPKLLKAETVYLPEGEKDVHTLEAWGLVASCNPGGSGAVTFTWDGWNTSEAVTSSSFQITMDRVGSMRRRLRRHC